MTPTDVDLVLHCAKYARFCEAVSWLCVLTADLPVDALRALRADPELRALEDDCERRLEDDECDEAALKAGCREWMLAWWRAVREQVPVV